MTLATIIQDRSNDGLTIVEFLFAVMRSELDGFKPCHRLDAAKLLVKYDLDEARNFTLDYTPEPSRPRPDYGSPDDNYFDEKLAQLIRESTDDGRKVCRFLINVMDGALSAFKPHHRISAARELLSRGFGKHAYPRRSGGGRNPEEAEQVDSHLSTPATQPSKSQESPNPTNQSSDSAEDEDHTDWDEVNALIDDAREDSDRILREQGIDPDNPPYKTDYSVFDEAADNSYKWFQEWKNSLDPEEFQAIVKEGAERFDAKIDLRIKRRKQIKADRARREKEEAERQAQQARARTEARQKEEAEAKEEEDLGPPPSREDHERWSPTPSIPTSFRLVNCGHPKCRLHDGPVYYPEDDKSSPYYWDGQQPSWFGTNRF